MNVFHFTQDNRKRKHKVVKSFLSAWRYDRAGWNSSKITKTQYENKNPSAIFFYLTYNKGFNFFNRFHEYENNKNAEKLK